MLTCPILAAVAAARAASGPTPAIAVGPFALLLLALPVLLAGEWLVQRIAWLARANIPAPVIGGLIVSLGILLCAEFRPGWVQVHGDTQHPFWLWPVLPHWGLTAPRPTDVERPLLILFFTCVGLNASWSLARRGGRPLVLFLTIAAGISVVQTLTGALTAVLMGQSPLLGLMSSIVSLMGGFGTVAGFAPEFEQAGLHGAATIGIAAAAFGVIAGGLLAGPAASRLIRTQLSTPLPPVAARDISAAVTARPSGLWPNVRALGRAPGSTLLHIAALLLCMKVGAFVSLAIQRAGITFPVYMGAMLVAALLRNGHDAANGRWLTTPRTDGIASVALLWLLTVVMIDLQLAQLAHAAWPMLVILAGQVVITTALAYWLVFRALGANYEAASLSAGLIGFGLGATSNAVATLHALADRFGPSPRALLIVTMVGAFLIDFVNALLITAALNFLR